MIPFKVIVTVKMGGYTQQHKLCIFANNKWEAVVKGVIGLGPVKDDNQDYVEITVNAFPVKEAFQVSADF